MDKFEDIKTKVDAYIDKYPSLLQKEYVEQASALIGIERVYIMIMGLGLVGFALFVIGGGNLVLKLLGTVYPAYMSFKAIDSTETSDDTHWLTYWVIYTAFCLTEPVTDMFISWIPFYFFFKCFFLIWCYNPHFDGSGVIYDNMIRPVLTEYIGMDLKARVFENKVVKGSPLQPVTVHVTIKQAKDITAMNEIDNTTDSYCIVKVDPPVKSSGSKLGGEGLFQKTKSKSKTLNPLWNEEITIADLPKRSVNDAGILKVTLQDKNTIGSDQFIGDISIPLSNKMIDNEIEKWYDLEDKDEKNPVGVKGAVLLKINVSSSA